jgi:hypothetical protein
MPFFFGIDSVYAISHAVVRSAAAEKKPDRSALAGRDYSLSFFLADGRKIVSFRQACLTDHL